MQKNQETLDQSDYSIKQAGSLADYAAAELLILQYVKELGVDLEFQDLISELKNLPTIYGPPQGALILVRSPESQPAGCAGIRSWQEPIAELKRMYIRPEFRKTGIGAKLLDHAIRAAHQLGYHRLRLDTLATMKSAQRLYLTRGFYEIPPYRYNPLPGTQFFELNLQDNSQIP